MFYNERRRQDKAYTAAKLRVLKSGNGVISVMKPFPSYVFNVFYSYRVLYVFTFFYFPILEKY